MRPRGFRESTSRGPAAPTFSSPIAPLLALVPLDSRDPSRFFLLCAIFCHASAVKGSHRLLRDPTRHCASKRPPADMARVANTTTNPHQPHPPVAPPPQLCTT